MVPFGECDARSDTTRIAVVCVFILAACTGSLDNGPNRPGDSVVGGQGSSSSPSSPAAPGAPGDPSAPNGTAPSGPSGIASAVVARCKTPAVGSSPLRRLTHDQYNNAVRDLLGDSTRPGLDFAKGTEEGLFDTMADQHVAPLLADQYLDAAVSLAEGVKDINALVGCDPAGTTSATCVRDFVKRFGRRAFRRPLTSAELDAFVALYNNTRTASDAPTGVRGVLAAVLASPNFLFRPEFGTQASNLPQALKASPFELSARLSWLLWASLPDDVLLDAAEKGQLETREQLVAQARRMLNDTRARAGMAAFYEQWFGLSMLSTTTKDAAVYPTFNDGLRSAMAEETRRFVDYVLWEDDAKLSTLLTAPYAFVNGALAKLYGVTAPKDPATFAKVPVDPKTRGGILTQSSFLSAFAASNTSSPVKRGKWLRTRMLCHDLPEPPANIPPLPPPKEGISTRERFAMHTASPACSGCHNLIDGLGFGLEAYDGIGAYRTTDLGVAVDTRGQINSTIDIDGPYSGASELSALLADSEQVRACAPTQWFRYAFGRREGPDDVCSVEAIQTAFKGSDGNLKELMLALVQTDAFATYRNPN